MARPSRTTETDDKKNKGWVAFGIWAVWSLLVTFVWIFLGCNLAAMAHSKPGSGGSLEVLFPAEKDFPPYVAGSDPPRPDPLDLFIANRYSAPYTLCPKPEACEGVWGGLKGWFVGSTKFSYLHGRAAIQGILNVLERLDGTASRATGSIDTRAPSSIISILIAPLLIPLIIGGAQVWGLLSNMIGQFASGHWIWALVLLFTGVGFMLASAIGSLQSMQTFVTFMGYGAYKNSDQFMRIASRHRRLFTGIFGFLLSVGAGVKLNPWAGITAAGVTVGMLATSKALE
jgi:hypothetical protein